MKVLLIIFLLISSSLIGYGQGDIIYLDKSYQKTDKDKAAFYQLKYPDSSEQGKYMTKTYYMSDTLRSVKSYSDLAHGPYISFYANGKVEEKGSYEDGKPIGFWEKYYSNGQPKEKGEYTLDEGNETAHYKLTSYWSEDGQQLVKDGNGNTFLTMTVRRL